MRRSGVVTTTRGNRKSDRDGNGNRREEWIGQEWQ
jgi:hypothetical protein